MSFRLIGSLFFLTVFASCYKNHLYVQQEWVNRSFLASTKVGTPDPRQKDFKCGQRLLIGWRFPQYMIDNGLELLLTVRFWDNSEESISKKMNKARGYDAFSFFGQEILTYRFQVINKECEVIETWEHQFWTELIDIDLKSSDVSSQPKHESVMEIP